MLFGNRKKRDEELLKYLDEAFTKTGNSISGMKEDLSEIGDRLLEEKLEKYQNENSRLLRRQSGSLEDILEELQRQGAETEDTARQLQELREREAALAELCCLLSGHRQMILQQLLSDSSLGEEAAAGWRRQAELMEQEAERAERKCAFQRIGICGEKVDYECHEILSVCAAQEEAQNGIVAQVFSEGYCYRGQIIKKAQVSVYRFEDNGNAENKDAML